MKKNKLLTYTIFFLIAINFLLGSQPVTLGSDTLYENFDESPRDTTIDTSVTTNFGWTDWTSGVTPTTINNYIVWNEAFTCTYNGIANNITYQSMNWGAHTIKGALYWSSNDTLIESSVTDEKSVSYSDGSPVTIVLTISGTCYLEAGVSYITAIWGSGTFARMPYYKTQSGYTLYADYETYDGTFPTTLTADETTANAVQFAYCNYTTTFYTKVAQTFKPDTTHNITSIKLPMYRVGSPSTCSIAVYSTSGGKPSSSISSESFDGNSLGTTPVSYPSGTEIVFSPVVEVTSGTTYAIVLSMPSGSSSNKVLWQRSISDSDYTDGDIFYYDGDSWENYAPTGDAYFYEYGTVGGGGGGGGGGPNGEPTNFTATAFSDTIILDWDKDEDAITTYIEKKTDAGSWIVSDYGFEGYGTDTRGAYNGSATPTIYYVTNLNDDGAGSFKYACEQSGARIVVFNVSGIIWLDEYITIDSPYITVAGQTAPSPGITLQGGIWIETHDVILQHIRVRWGADSSYYCEWQDCIQIGQSGVTSYNVVIDHCSVSWSCDENMGTWYAGHHITWQWNIISEGFISHSCGLITSPDMYSTSIHHNLFAHNAERNPFIRGYGNFEVINNVVYNWKDDGTNIGAETSAHYGNIIGNYYKEGLSTTSSYGGISVWMSAISASRYYIHNTIDVEN